MYSDKQKTGFTDEPRVMTLQQRAELQEIVNGRIRLWTASAFAVGSLSLLLIVLPRNGVEWLLGLFIFGFVTFSAFTALYKRHLLSLDLHADKLASLEGEITLDVLTNNRGGVGYRLQVEGLEFAISKETFLSLSNHQSYRVYYAPHSKIYFDAEPLF